MSYLKIKVITPSNTLTLDDIMSISLKTIGGDLTILPNHYPLMSAIEVTKITFKREDKSILLAFASEGLISVLEHEIVLILNAFEFKDQIDRKRAQASYERAYQRLNGSNKEDVDIFRAEAAMKRALTRLNILDE